MNEFKGTKGKWVATPNSYFYDISVEGNPSRSIAFNIILFNNENGKAISLSKENKANALLISKAPELLEAMQEFCDRVDKGEVRSTKTYSKFKQLIKQATEVKP